MSKTDRMYWGGYFFGTLVTVVLVASGVVQLQDWRQAVAFMAANVAVIGCVALIYRWIGR